MEKPQDYSKLIKNHDPIILDRRIKQFPLTAERVREFLPNIERARFKDVNGYGTSFNKNGNGLTYILIFSCNNSKEEQAITLIHEIVHTYYNSGTASSQQIERIESIVEGEAIRFYNENKEFTDKLLKDIKEHLFWINKATTNKNRIKINLNFE